MNNKEEIEKRQNLISLLYFIIILIINTVNEIWFNEWRLSGLYIYLTWLFGFNKHRF